MRKSLQILSLVTFAFPFSHAVGISTATAQHEPTVVVSIKPVHSLAAWIMDGVATPDLIIDGAGSPHGYTLKPSQARALESADAVFWIGHELESFLEKPLETIASQARVVGLFDADGIKHLPVREGEGFDHHDHADHEGHDHGEQHAHEDEHEHDEKHAHEDEHEHDEKHAHEDEHEHDEKHAHEDEHEHDDDHGHAEASNPHIWLDPENAKAMARVMSATLIEIDPANAATYEKNTTTLITRLDQLIGDMDAFLRPVQGRPFVVFHDAYHYFEDRFGLTAAGSITLEPETPPSAERLSELRQKIQTLDATCIFSEPQFPSKMVDVVIEGSSAKTAVLDPLGAAMPAGPRLYLDVLTEMAAAFKTCLSTDS